MAVIGAAAAMRPFALSAQHSGKDPRLGFLISETLAGTSSRVEALRAGLRELGYVEGKNIAIEYRAADGNYERLPELAGELVRLKVDVVVAFGSKAVLAAKAATTTIPIVVPSSADPVALGVVSGLARPGGNITGIAMFAPEMYAKRVALLKEAVPRIARVAVTQNPANPSGDLIFRALRAAAQGLKLELRSFKVRAPNEFGSSFSAMTKARVDAVVISQDTLFRAHDKEIAVLAATQRLPSVGTKEFAQAGGLIGYGVDDAELFHRGAYFVDRILKGAKPVDLPVERPTRFELFINLKTAKSLGIKIPQSMIVRADRVID